MSESEKRELAAWIAEHVMNWQRVKKSEQLDHAGRYCLDYGGNVLIHAASHESPLGFKFFTPTTDHAAAMLVQEKCAEFLGRKNHALSVGKNITKWRVCEIGTDQFYAAEAETLPLAMAIFSKVLLSK